jgi:hypothetical protein
MRRNVRKIEHEGMKKWKQIEIFEVEIMVPRSLSNK